jgi:hypothetical protein
VFAVPGVSSVRATSLNQSYDEDLTEEASLGTYIQQQFGLNDRLFLTAGVRADDHSAFGSNFDRVYYPKFSLSWVASEEPFWPLPQVNTLKLRAAYGESGKAPETFSSVRTFSPAIGPAGTAAVTPRDIGNPNLGPERGKELELGFDAGFFDDRLGLEFTWYRKRTIDAILDRDVPGSIGFIGDPANQLFARQFFNAGEIRNSGIELLARGRPFESDNAGLELTFTLATNDNEIVSLGEPDLTRVTASTYREHRVGHPVGAWWERRIVSATLDATGTATNVLCDDGSGGGMDCNTAPFVYLGRTVPKVEGGLGATLTLFRNLRFYGLVDWKSGHKKLDGNTRVRCTFFGGRCRENYFPLEFDANRIAGVQSGPNVTVPTIVDFLIDDASFAKLRELSAAYTLPERWARAMGASRAQVGIAGRNLITWTDYGGLEPEAMFMGGSRGGSNGAWEQTTLPQLTQWVFSVNLGY